MKICGKSVWGGMWEEVSVRRYVCGKCIGTIREGCRGGVSEEVGVYMYEGGMCVGEVCEGGGCAGQ